MCLLQEFGPLLHAGLWLPCAGFPIKHCELSVLLPAALRKQSDLCETTLFNKYIKNQALIVIASYLLQLLDHCIKHLNRSAKSPFLELLSYHMEPCMQNNMQAVILFLSFLFCLQRMDNDGK